MEVVVTLTLLLAALGAFLLKRRGRSWLEAVTLSFITWLLIILAIFMYAFWPNN